MDWLSRRSIATLAEVSSPLGCINEYMRLQMFVNLDVFEWCGIPHQHLQSNHVPDVVWNKPISENEEVMNALMSVRGYELVKRSSDDFIYVSVPIHDTKRCKDFFGILKTAIPNATMYK
jgi:hypothetical protein